MGKKRRLKIPVFIGVLVLSAFSLASSHGKNQEGAIYATTRRGGRHSEIQRLLEQAAECEQRQDWSGAEINYRQACELVPFLTGLRGNLARLLDRRGAERLALDEYRIVFEGHPRSVSTEESDPRILSRYGDLALKHGSQSEAQKAYLAATTRYGGLGNSHLPRPAPRTMTLESLRSSAYVAAALKYWAIGEDEKFASLLDEAVKLDPDSWIVRFHHARSLRRLDKIAEARQEYAKARSLAKGQGKESFDSEFSMFPEIRPL